MFDQPKNESENPQSNEIGNQNANSPYSSYTPPEIPIVNNNENLPLYVTEPIVVKDKLKSYVLYTFCGKYIGQPLSRRFSDFFALRTKLVERWPGVYIPNIPHKKAMGNLHQKFIENRVKLINKFCLSLHQMKEIFNSNEIEVFLQNSIDVKKCLELLPSQSYSDLYEKYKRSFLGYYEAFDLLAAREKLNLFFTSLMKTKENIKRFKEVINNCRTKFQSEIDSILGIINIFSFYEKTTLMEVSGHDEDKLVFFNLKNTDLCMSIVKIQENMENPYVPLYEAIQEEELNIEAMLEAMNSLSSLQDDYEKMRRKLDSVEGTVKILQAGKWNFKTLLSFKSKADTLIEYEKERETLNKDLTSLGFVIKLATYHMEYSIQFFKVTQVVDYYRQLKVLADLQKGNNSMLNNLCDSIMKDRNIQTIAKTENSIKGK